MTDGDMVAEILGRAISEILPEHRASGTPTEHAQSTAKALLAAFESLRTSRETARREASLERVARKETSEAWERDRKEDRELFGSLVEALRPGAVMSSEELLGEVAALKTALDAVRAERDQAHRALVEATARHAETVGASVARAEAWEAATHAARRELQRAIDDLDKERARAKRAEAQARNFADTVALLRKDDAVNRAERAEAGLAALREAYQASDGDDPRYPVARGQLAAAVADTDAAAEAYTRRVRAKALREAADAADGRGILTGGHFARILHARADEIEGGR